MVDTHYGRDFNLIQSKVNVNLMLSEGGVGGGGYDLLRLENLKKCGFCGIVVRFHLSFEKIIFFE